MCAPSPSTAVVVAAVAILVVLLSLKGPFTIQFGTKLSRIMRLQGKTSDNTYTVGTVYVKLVSTKPMEGYTDLDWKLFLKGRDAPVGTGTIRAHPGSNKTIWGWRVRARWPGYYRLVVVDNTDRTLKQGYCTAVPK